MKKISQTLTTYLSWCNYVIFHSSLRWLACLLAGSWTCRLLPNGLRGVCGFTYPPCQPCKQCEVTQWNKVVLHTQQQESRKTHIQWINCTRKLWHAKLHILVTILSYSNLRVKKYVLIWCVYCTGFDNRQNIVSDYFL